MDNKTLITLTGLSAVIFLIGQVSIFLFKSFQEAHFLAKTGVRSFEIFAVILFLKNGTLIKRPCFKLLAAFLLLLITAFLNHSNSTLHKIIYYLKIFITFEPNYML